MAKVLGILLCLSIAAGNVCAAQELPEVAVKTAQEHTSALPVVVVVRLELSAKADLSVADIKKAPFPSGKRLAFHLSGVRETIAYFNKLGFHTDIGVGCDADPAFIKKIEDAGAEITLTLQPPPGAAAGPGFSSSDNMHFQEGFDRAVLARQQLKAKCRGPVIITSNIPNGKFIDQIPSTNEKSLNQRHGSGMWLAYYPNRDLRYYQHCNYVSNGSEILLHRVTPKDLLDKFEIINHDQENDVECFLKYKMGGYGENIPNTIIFYQSLPYKFRTALEARTKEEPPPIIEWDLRDFSPEDLEKLKRYIEPYGNHPLLWHPSRGEAVACQYLKYKSKVRDVRVVGDTVVDISLELDSDVFPAFLLSPLTLKLPKGFPLKAARVGNQSCTVTVGQPEHEGVFIDVPVQAALKDGCEMTLSTSAPNMTIPDEMGIKLTVRNTSDKRLENATLRWTSSLGAEVAFKAGAPLTFEPKSEQTLEAVVRTPPGSIYFGVAAIQAIVTGNVNGDERTFMAGFEISILPRVAVSMDPQNPVRIAKDDTQAFLLTLSNRRSAPGRYDHALHYKTGALKGVVTWNVPDGTEITPSEQKFELAADSEQELVFKIKNNIWSKDSAVARPRIRFDGEKDDAEVIQPGVRIFRNQDGIDYKPLDEQGLTLYASWNDPSQEIDACDRAIPGTNNRTIGTKSDKQDNKYSPIGVSGWCAGARRNGNWDMWKTVNHKEGAVLLWTRADPEKRNENQFRPDRTQTWKMRGNCGNGPGELLVGGFCAPQDLLSAQCEILLRRFPGWEGKKGYLEAVYWDLGNRAHYVQVDFDRSEEWKHIGLLWNLKDRRLEIYINGVLAGKADAGDREWYGVPFDCACTMKWAENGFSYGGIADGGKLSLSLVDEFYIYNRALTLEEIKANMEKAAKK